MERLLAAAAELRAAGNSWEVVGAKLHRAADTCRRWPKRYPTAWEQLYEAAERTQMGEAQAEATAMLRTHLRLKDTKEIRDAAKALLTAASRNRAAKTKPRELTEQELSEALSNVQIQDLNVGLAETVGEGGA
jgi:hypothetical protein